MSFPRLIRLVADNPEPREARSAKAHATPTAKEVAAIDRFYSASDAIASLYGHVEELRRLAAGRYVPTVTQLEEVAEKLRRGLAEAERHLARRATSSGGGS